jgi:hypothetical protein
MVRGDRVGLKATTSKSSGKRYFEITLGATTNNSTYGIAKVTADMGVILGAYADRRGIVPSLGSLLNNGSAAATDAKADRNNQRSASDRSSDPQRRDDEARIPRDLNRPARLATTPKRAGLASGPFSGWGADASCSQLNTAFLKKE